MRSKVTPNVFSGIENLLQRKASNSRIPSVFFQVCWKSSAEGS